MKRKNKTKNTVCKHSTELNFRHLWLCQSKLYCHNVCWKYFAKKFIMLFTCFINWRQCTCNCIWCNKNYDCGLRTFLDCPSRELGFPTICLYNFCPLHDPVGRSVYVARGFVTSEMSTWTSLQSGGAKIYQLPPLWDGPVHYDFILGPCRG